mgnify:CR=1 FL=1
MTSAYVTALLARRQTIYDELNAMTQTSKGGKPNTRNQDGGLAIDHVGYRLSLYKELREIDALLLQADQIDDVIAGTSGSFVVETHLHQ